MNRPLLRRLLARGALAGAVAWAVAHAFTAYLRPANVLAWTALLSLCG